MYNLTIPFNNKTVKLKPVTVQDTLDFFYLGDDLTTIINKLESFIITKDLSLLEKLYSLFYLRDTCVGSLINLKDFAIDINVFLSEFEEIIDIEKKLKIDNFIIELDYPYNFSLHDNDETDLIKSIEIDNEKVILNNLNKKDRGDILNNLSLSLLQQIKNYKSDNENNLRINFKAKGNNYILKYLSTDLVYFLKNIFTALNPYTYRHYIFQLSKRMHDINFLTSQSTLVDLQDYLDLYIKESEESKGIDENNLDGF